MYCLFLTKMFQKYKAVITSLLMHIWKYNKTEIVKRSPWHNLSKHYNTSRTFDSLIFSFHSQSFLLSQRESIQSRIAAWFYIFTIFPSQKNVTFDTDSLYLLTLIVSNASLYLCSLITSVHDRTYQHICTVSFNDCKKLHAHSTLCNLKRALLEKS